MQFVLSDHKDEHRDVKTYGDYFRMKLLEKGVGLLFLLRSSRKYSILIWKTKKISAVNFLSEVNGIFFVKKQ